jgi:hypothetical protein
MENKVPYCRHANDTKRVIAEVYLTLHSSTVKNKLSNTTLLLGAFYTYPFGGFLPHCYLDLHTVKFAL